MVYHVNQECGESSQKNCTNRGDLQRPRNVAPEIAMGKKLGNRLVTRDGDE